MVQPNNDDVTKTTLRQPRASIALSSAMADSRLHVAGTMRRDITSTPLYKEIYANNIRRYSYIVAKQIGAGNHSPQQLRKMYLHHQKKATQRNSGGENNDTTSNAEMTPTLKTPSKTPYGGGETNAQGDKVDCQSSIADAGKNLRAAA